MIIEYIVLIEGRWWFTGNIYVLPKFRYDNTMYLVMLLYLVIILSPYGCQCNAVIIIFTVTLLASDPVYRLVLYTQ